MFMFRCWVRSSPEVVSTARSSGAPVRGLVVCHLCRWWNHMAYCLKVELGPLGRSLGTVAAHSGWQLAVKLLVWVLPEVAMLMRPRTASQCRAPQRMADGPKMAGSPQGGQEEAGRPPPGPDRATGSWRLCAGWRPLVLLPGLQRRLLLELPPRLPSG